MGGSLRGRHCCTRFCCTVVSGWVDSFVAVVVCSCRVSTASWDIFFFYPFSPGIPAPRWNSAAPLLIVKYFEVFINSAIALPGVYDRTKYGKQK